MTEPTPSAAVNLPAQFNVRPYQPDGGFSSTASAQLIGVEMIAGAGLGFLASFIGQWFYMVLIFPFLIGLALGGIGQFIIKSTRIRNPWLGGVAGFLGGCVAMTMAQYFDYQRFLDQREEDRKKMPVQVLRALRQDAAARERVVNVFPADKRDQVRREMEQGALDEQVEGFVSYLHVAATKGVSIGSTHDFGRENARGFNLGYWGTIIYWVVELLIVAAVAWGMGYEASRQPYCAITGDWKREQVVGQMMASAAACKELVDNLNAGRIARPSAPNNGGPPETVQVVAFVSPGGPEHDIDVRLLRLSRSAKGEVQKSSKGEVTYPGAALPYLEALFTEPVSPDASVPGVEV